jgi:hypothetical protein
MCWLLISRGLEKLQKIARHSREGGESLLLLFFVQTTIKAKSDSRLRGNDELKVVHIQIKSL